MLHARVFLLQCGFRPEHGYAHSRIHETSGHTSKLPGLLVISRIAGSVQVCGFDGKFLVFLPTDRKS